MASIGQGPAAYEADFAAVPADSRNETLWTQCSIDAGLRGGAGLGIGVAAAFIVSRKPFARGLVSGLATGVGVGIAGVDCAERARAMWSVNAREAAAAARRDAAASTPAASTPGCS